jgi:hypothetical protein
MKLELPGPREAPAILRALYTAAAHDGPLIAAEKSMLNAARELMGAQAAVIEQTITPKELADAVSSVALRRQVLSGMVVMNLLDEAGSPEDAAFVNSFASELGVDSNEVRNLQQIADGDLFTMKLDVARRVWITEHLAERWNKGGLRWLARAVGTKLGLAEETKLADRYRALGHLPQGTVGRTYFDSMRADGFPLPGEKGSQVEPVVIHDLMHVLSGYATDAEGEIQTAAFSAGNRRQDPFTYLFFVLCQFHLGIIEAPFSFSARGRFDPAAVVRAVNRGMAVTTDLSSGWDPWSIMAITVDDARASLGVPPV